ncbi:unnamed protein product [Cyclocybe aegerita]|uniref:Chorismate mutase n=1 Tax=Cyclocybe aegerita TaxID=1973307 RepID=A0A8S0W441_CYCAE|nr:unnamed protein product [Cyclocybe aegerita]
MPSLNFMTGEDPLSLDRIRSVLIRLEDTIIFSLIERAQFAHNPRIYQRGAFKELVDLGFEGSWLEWFLKETESFHGASQFHTPRVRVDVRSCDHYLQRKLEDTPASSILTKKPPLSTSSPDEYPFTTDLPEPVLQPLNFPSILYPNKVNANASIFSFYTNAIVPRITRRATLALSAKKRANGITGSEEFEDDGNYGSAATLDVEVLQSISKRVHYGKFVSESKFQENPAAFVPHIQKRNREALEALITKPEVEQRLLRRLGKKATTYAQDIAADGEAPAYNGLSPGKGVNASSKIDVDGVVDLYESYIIPLTKEVEVDYLLNRLEGLSQQEIDRLAQPKSL